METMGLLAKFQQQSLPLRLCPFAGNLSAQVSRGHLLPDNPVILFRHILRTGEAAVKGPQCESLVSSFLLLGGKDDPEWLVSAYCRCEARKTFSESSRTGKDVHDFYGLGLRPVSHSVTCFPKGSRHG